MIPITHADGRAEQKLLRQLKARSGEVDRKVTAAVTAILDNVRQNGDQMCIRDSSKAGDPCFSQGRYHRCDQKR